MNLVNSRELLQWAVNGAKEKFGRDLSLVLYSRRMFDDKKDKGRVTAIRFHLSIGSEKNKVFIFERTLFPEMAEKISKNNANDVYNELSRQAIQALLIKGINTLMPVNEQQEV